AASLYHLVGSVWGLAPTPDFLSQPRLNRAYCPSVSLRSTGHTLDFSTDTAATADNFLDETGRTLAVVDVGFFSKAKRTCTSRRLARKHSGPGGPRRTTDASRVGQLLRGWD